MAGRRSTGSTRCSSGWRARKTSQIAAVAVARELAGFVWALMQEGAVETKTGRRAA